MIPPKCVREVRSFIGMCSYYGFIPHFPAIAKPVINLTKKFANLNGLKECQIAFDFLRRKLKKCTSLGIPRY